MLWVLFLETPLHADSYAINEDNNARFLINVLMDIAKFFDRNSRRDGVISNQGNMYEIFSISFSLGGKTVGCLGSLKSASTFSSLATGV